MRKTLLLLCAAASLAACASVGRAPDCNLYVIALMKQKNIYLPQKNANGLDNYLKTSEAWTKVPRVNGKLDHAAAYNAAKSGRATLVTYNTGTGSSGHIAQVYGGKKPAWSQSYNAYVPYVKSTLQGRKPSIDILSRQFQASKERKMNYYIYNK